MRIRRNINRELAGDMEGRRRPLPWPFELAAMSLDVFFVVSKFVVMLEIIFNNDIALELAFNEIKSTLALKRRSSNGGTQRWPISFWSSLSKRTESRGMVRASAQLRVMVSVEACIVMATALL